MSDKQKGSSSSTKDVQLNSNPNEVRSFEELEHCLEEYGRCEDCQQPNTGINTDQEWRRSGVDSWKGNGFVCLKRFNDSANMTSEFFEEGLRPKIKNRVPQLLLDLVNSCLDAEPNNRVSAKELTDILTQYYKDVHVKNKEAKIYQQIEAIEKSTESSGYKPNKSTRLSYATHTQAIYTSRLLDYGNLPNPVNYTPEESKQLELVIPDSNDYTFEDEDN
ncbi:1280_t:CDS:2 [Entrophospora sp. SA101]|nr:1280_t:CDS:2 [Entrophospora sp. SA101]